MKLGGVMGGEKDRDAYAKHICEGKKGKEHARGDIITCADL